MPKTLRTAHVFNEKWRSNDVRLSEKTDFSSLLLSERVLLGLENSGFKTPSPIQIESIPVGLIGKDLVVQAKSGTGKTLVFTIIALESLLAIKVPQVLILAPTREIAIQIRDVIRSVGSATKGLTCNSFIGGMPVSEDTENVAGCQIIVGTPGRVKQLINIGCLSVISIRLFVLDEADVLLERSFLDDLNSIFMKLPVDKQVIATSATYPKELKAFSQQYFRDIYYARLNKTELALLGMVHYTHTLELHKMPLLAYAVKLKFLEKVLSSINFTQCLVFCNLISRVESLCFDIRKWGFSTAYISSAKEQCDRLKAIDCLKRFRCKVLVSSDVTSRGIDAENVDLIVNFDMPHNVEIYMHRVGRAGRYGSVGLAVTFLTRDEEEIFMNIKRDGNFQAYDLPVPLPSNLITMRPKKSEDLKNEKEQLLDNTNSKANAVEVDSNLNEIVSDSENISKNENISTILSDGVTVIDNEATADSTENIRNNSVTEYINLLEKSDMSINEDKDKEGIFSSVINKDNQELISVVEKATNNVSVDIKTDIMIDNVKCSKSTAETINGEVSCENITQKETVVNATLNPNAPSESEISELYVIQESQTIKTGESISNDVTANPITSNESEIPELYIQETGHTRSSEPILNNVIVNSNTHKASEVPDSCEIQKSGNIRSSEPVSDSVAIIPNTPNESEIPELSKIQDIGSSEPVPVKDVLKETDTVVNKSCKSEMSSTIPENNDASTTFEVSSSTPENKDKAPTSQLPSDSLHLQNKSIKKAEKNVNTSVLNKIHIPIVKSLIRFEKNSGSQNACTDAQSEESKSTTIGKVNSLRMGLGNYYHKVFKAYKSECIKETTYNNTKIMLLAQSANDVPNSSEENKNGKGLVEVEDQKVPNTLDSQISSEEILLGAGSKSKTEDSESDNSSSSSVSIHMLESTLNPDKSFNRYISKGIGLEGSSSISSNKSANKIINEISGTSNGLSDNATSDSSSSESNSENNYRGILHQSLNKQKMFSSRAGNGEKEEGAALNKKEPLKGDKAKSHVDGHNGTIQSQGKLDKNKLKPKISNIANEKQQGARRKVYFPETQSNSSTSESSSQSDSDSVERFLLENKKKTISKVSQPQSAGKGKLDEKEPKSKISSIGNHKQQGAGSKVHSSETQSNSSTSESSSQSDSDYDKRYGPKISRETLYKKPSVGAKKNRKILSSDCSDNDSNPSCSRRISFEGHVPNKQQNKSTCSKKPSTTSEKPCGNNSFQPYCSIQGYNPSFPVYETAEQSCKDVSRPNFCSGASFQPHYSAFQPYDRAFPTYTAAHCSSYTNGCGSHKVCHSNYQNCAAFPSCGTTNQMSSPKPVCSNHRCHNITANSYCSEDSCSDWYKIFQRQWQFIQKSSNPSCQNY